MITIPDPPAPPSHVPPLPAPAAVSTAQNRLKSALTFLQGQSIDIEFTNYSDRGGQASFNTTTQIGLAQINAIPIQQGSFVVTATLTETLLHEAVHVADFMSLNIQGARDRKESLWTETNAYSIRRDYAEAMGAASVSHVWTSDMTSSESDAMVRQKAVESTNISRGFSPMVSSGSPNGK